MPVIHYGNLKPELLQNLLILLCLCQLALAQRKTFTGDVNIFGYDDFEAFINENYTHIEGNLTIIQSINNVAWGFDIGAKLPEKVAISIIAEMIAFMRSDEN